MIMIMIMMIMIMIMIGGKGHFRTRGSSPSSFEVSCFLHLRLFYEFQMALETSTGVAK
jgi:hypothetical protein